MPELLREPAELRRRIERLERDGPAGAADDAHWEAVAEGCFRLAVHVSTPVHEAIGLLRRAAKIDGGNPKYPYHLGRIFLLYGRLERARKWFGVAVRICPTSHRLWTHISLLQRELNERFRTDQSVLQDDLRKRSDKLAGQVKDGADRVDESLLAFEPRKRADAKRPGRRATAMAGPGKSASGDGKPSSTWVVHRVQNAGRCRWSGVIDLQVEHALEAEPRQATATRLLRLLNELSAMVRNRKGGATGLAVLAVEWLVKGYPTSTIRHLIEELQVPAADPSIELLATSCRLFEAEEADLPPLLAQCVRDNAVPPLLAVLIHERRLLWNVPHLGRLGAVFRTAERFMDRIEQAEGVGGKQHDELTEQAGALTELLDRATRELDRKPPTALKIVVQERDEPDTGTVENQQHLKELGREAEEIKSQVRKDWQRLRDLMEKNKHGRLDATDLSVATAISERVESMLARCETVIKDLEERKRSGTVESKDATQELDNVKQTYLKLKDNKGRFARSLTKLRLRKAETVPEVDGPAVAATTEKAPTDPLELLANRLQSIESRIREEFDRAERTFTAYGDGALQLAPIKALRRSVRARKAEALYRLGRRQEARRIWIGILGEDPLDAGALKNVAVCDLERRDLARHLQSWKSFIEILYYFDILAGDPRPHARERAELHRALAGAYAPRFLADEKMDTLEVDTTQLKSFLASPRLTVFLGHKLLEILNERLDYSSPPIILGIDRSAREESREHARNSTHDFVRITSEWLPDRIRDAFWDVTRNHIDAAFEATASARRLTLKQDPYYSGEKERYAKWLREFIQFKVRLYSVVAHRLPSLIDLPTLEWTDQLQKLDSVPIGNSPEFLQQFVENWEQCVGLMGALGDAAFTLAINSGEHAKVRHLLPKKLEADDCPKQLLQVAISCEVEAVEAVKEDLGEEAFAGILERWLERLAGDAATDSPTSVPIPEPAFRELDAVHRVFGLVEHRIECARTALKEAEGEPGEIGHEDISADELEVLGERLEKARTHIFLSPFIIRYNAIMSQVDGAIHREALAVEMTKQLQQLRRSLAKAQRLLTHSADYRQLKERIDKNLEDLQGQAEVQLVNEVVARFNELMESTKDGALSPRQVAYLSTEMHKLKMKVANLRSQVKSSQGQTGLEDLSTAIDKILARLDG